jgi:methionyl-tRNA synthetase
MSKPFFVSTAIDYTNGAPHIGHAYEKVLADAIARFHRLQGQPVYFLTGVDQHGQKVQQTAEKAGIHPATHVKKVTKLFSALWQKLGLSHDAWIETTDDRHKKAVQHLLQQLHDTGQLYKKSQKGYYSVRQEQFVTDKERGPDGQFGPEWGVVEEREEENWYFRLSEHVGWLRSFLAAHPETVFPDSRLTQLTNAVKDSEGQDLCISRPKARLRWGIELPFDPDFVTYVWFDALTNYISGAGWPSTPWVDGAPSFADLWPNECNIIGKDILIPAHGIYWLTMLHAAGFTDAQMPRFLVHGWWNIRGEKMSKSVGNVVDPNELADRFTSDGLRYYLLTDITTGQDSDFSTERLLVRYQAELANGLGNLLNRSLNMTQRYCEGKLTITEATEPLDLEIQAAVKALPAAYQAPMTQWAIHRSMEELWKLIDLCNRYIEKTEPFKLAKDPAQTHRVPIIMQHLCEALAHISVYLEPVCPTAAATMRSQLGWEKPATLTFDQLRWGLLPAGHTIGKPKPLFPRIEVTAEAAPE